MKYNALILTLKDHGYDSEFFTVYSLLVSQFQPCFQNLVFFRIVVPHISIFK